MLLTNIKTFTWYELTKQWLKGRKTNKQYKLKVIATTNWSKTHFKMTINTFLLELPQTTSFRLITIKHEYDTDAMIMKTNQNTRKACIKAAQT